jgi:hypothetical protein
VAWLVFLGAGPILWVSGIAVFVRSSLSTARKLVWTVVLLLVGSTIGVLLPLDGIRDRFLLLAAALPLLALADVWLMRGRRGFSFWFRACAFEICTVFAAAAVVRKILDATRGAG